MYLQSEPGVDAGDINKKSGEILKWWEKLQHAGKEVTTEIFQMLVMAEKTLKNGYNNITLQTVTQTHV